MNDIEKRPRYFNGQFLDQDDFNLSLDYVRERAQRHQRLFHGPGIAGDGLAVTAGVGAQSVTVAPGTAVDALGQQIVLLESSRLPLTNLPNQTALVVISYHEEPADMATTGTKAERRWLERPTVALVQETGAPPEDTHLRLARLQIEDGKVKTHDPSVRRVSGARMASVDTRKLSLSREDVAPAAWPSLTCGGAGLAEVANELRVRGTLHLNVSGRPASLSGVDGKLGIGTADPKASVEVNSGNADVSAILAVSTPNGGDFFSIYGARENGQSNDLLWRRGPLRFGTATSFGGQAFSEKMRITETGNVGIGNANPAEKLHVGGNARVDGILQAMALGVASLTVTSILTANNKSTLAQEAWKTPTFQSGWRDFAPGWNPGGFMIDSMGFVHLRGMVATVPPGQAGVIIDKEPYSVIFTLPAGYRPPFRELLCVQTWDTLGRVDIAVDGQVFVIRGNTGWVSLDGIIFRAASA